MAERLTSAFEEPIRTAGNTTVRLTASVGVAVATSPTTNGKDLLDRADQAMYRAKRQGRGRVHIDVPPGVMPNPSRQDGEGIRTRVLSALWAQ